MAGVTKHDQFAEAGKHGDTASGEQPHAAEPNTIGAETARRGLPVASLVPLSAVAWWVIGFLPWLLSGLNGSGLDTRRGVGATALAVPLTVADLGALVQGSALGGLLAGSLCLLARPASRGLVIAATFSGTAIASAVAITVSAMTILQDGGVAGYGMVLGPVCLVAAFWTLVGWGVGAAAVLGRPGLSITLAALAGFGSAWLTSVLLQILPVEPYDMAWVSELATWVGAAVLAVALVVLGWRPGWRVALWPVVVLIPWLIGAGLTATEYLAHGLNSRIASLNRLPDTIDGSIDVFWLASLPDTRPVLPWLVAIAVGIVGTILLSRSPARSRPFLVSSRSLTHIAGADGEHTAHRLPRTHDEETR